MDRVQKWKRGDVALVTLSQPGFNPGRGSGPFLMQRGVSGIKEVWRLASTGIIHEDKEVADVRPLVVIDPEDREQVERLLVALDARAHTDCESGTCRINQAQAALRDLSAPTPPKPEEPGRYGVIEDAAAVEWVHADLIGVNQWHSIEGKRSRWADWSDINVARVLSEGVPA